jgi:hypothetical protein
VGSLFGFEIKSDLPLRRLNAAAGTRGELRIETASEPLSPPDHEPVGTLIDDDGHCWYAGYDLGGERCLLRLPPTASFLLEPSRLRLAVDSEGDDDELLEHRIASSAVCTLLSMRSDLVLHASAVEVDGLTVVFCGPTQRGKSTLARVLGESGHRLLGEDGVVVALRDGAPPTAFPGPRGVRARSRDDDGRVRTELLTDPGPGEPPSCPVGAVVLLEERGAALAVDRLEPARALALLTPNLIHSGSREAIGRAFANLASLLGSVPAFAASLPDDLAALPRSAPALIDAMAGGS